VAAFECIRVLVSDTAAAERVSAEVFEAGASGLEEREVAGGEGTACELRVYAPAPRAREVEAALARLEASEPRGAVRTLDTAPAPEEDWSRRWRAGLGVVRISPRLAVRPPFVPDDAGGVTVVIDPGQAFGTGGHASTRLALALLDDLPASLLDGARVLDVGTGSGVLALAAVALGARSALGLDLDRVAVLEARRNAALNGLAEQARFFAGPLDAVGREHFDIVLANLLRTEVLPVLPAIASALARGGHAVLSGLLVTERVELEAALAAAGLAVVRAREEPDPSGDAWLGLLTRR
jgi:ribosomal protein L11 methyltransferase